MGADRMTPRVSIITTVYDRVDCLARCLRSATHLAFRDFEQIVVSDNPPEPALSQIAALCAEAGVQHVNLPARTNNWGIGPAEHGLRLAQGEYVCFLSDDNAFLPNHFAPLVAALDADPYLGFVYSSCLYAGARELRWSPPMGARIDLGQPLFRRSVLRDVVHDTMPAQVFAWDWELLAVLLNAGVTWRHIDEATFVFRLAAYPQLVEALA
jgi:glycosyltransferase involved in cell wall biosynthesis